MKRVTWVLHPSKFCNLRCAYCYEWNDLGKRERMSIELLRRCFVAVRDHHVEATRRFGPTTSSVSWLGGEPLILPRAYLDEIASLQREVLGELLDRGECVNVVQTNLYTLRDDVLQFVKAWNWGVGISLDVVPGVRLSVVGNPTEARVLRNLERLRAEGIEPEAITVLARHTAPRICEIHDFFVEKGLQTIRILPLFDGPSERPIDRCATDDATLISAMCRLFVHWWERGQPITVVPLQEYLEAVLRRMVGIRFRLFDRRREGESVLIVNTNGDVYQLLDAYDLEKSLGNLRTQTIGEILASERTQISLERDDALRERLCGQCPYAGFCSGWPIYDSPREGTYRGHCTIAHPVQSFIEAYLREQGIDEREMGGVLREHAAALGA